MLNFNWGYWENNRVYFFHVVCGPSEFRTPVKKNCSVSIKINLGSTMHEASGSEAHPSRPSTSTPASATPMHAQCCGEAVDAPLREPLRVTAAPLASPRCHGHLPHRAICGTQTHAAFKVRKREVPGFTSPTPMRTQWHTSQWSVEGSRGSACALAKQVGRRGKSRAFAWAVLHGMADPLTAWLGRTQTRLTSLTVWFSL